MVETESCSGSRSSSTSAVLHSSITGVCEESGQSPITLSTASTTNAAALRAPVGATTASDCQRMVTPFESAGSFEAIAECSRDGVNVLTPRAAAVGAAAAGDASENPAGVASFLEGEAEKAPVKRTQFRQEGENRSRRGSEMPGPFSGSGVPKSEPRQQQQQDGRKDAAAGAHQPSASDGAVSKAGENVGVAAVSSSASSGMGARVSPAGAAALTTPRASRSKSVNDAQVSSVETGHASVGAPAVSAPAVSAPADAAQPCSETVSDSRRSALLSMIPTGGGTAGCVAVSSPSFRSPHTATRVTAAASPSAASTTPATPTRFSFASSDVAVAAPAVSPALLFTKASPSNASSAASATPSPIPSLTAPASRTVGSAGDAPAGAATDTVQQAKQETQSPHGETATGETGDTVATASANISRQRATDKPKVPNCRTIQFGEVFVAPSDVALASQSQLSDEPSPTYSSNRGRCNRRGGPARWGSDVRPLTLQRSVRSSRNGGGQDLWTLMHGFTCRCETLPGSTSAVTVARGESERGRRSTSSSIGDIWGGCGVIAPLGVPLPDSCRAWIDLCWQRFPLFFSNVPLEHHFARLQLEHISARTLLLTPLLMLACGCSYYAAFQNCIGTAMCAAYAVEVGVAELCLLGLLIALKCPIDPLWKELFSIGFIATVGMCRSVICYVAFAVPAVYPAFFPLYAAASVLLNFLFLFLAVVCICIRVGYATWLILLFLLLTLAVGLLSLIRSIGAEDDSMRLWLTWFSVFIFVFPLLTIVLLMEATLREQQRRGYFLRMRNLTVEKQQVDAEAGAVLRSRSVRSSLAESVLACAVRQLLEAHRRLRKNEPFDRELLAALLEGAAKFITSREATVPPEYMKNEFTRSFVRDLLMGRPDCASLANLPATSMRRRSACITDADSSISATFSSVGKDWNWDILQLGTTVSEPLVQVGTVLLSPFEGSSDVMLQPAVLRGFLREVEKSCKPNPYHNALHNASVAHQAMSLLRMIGLREFVGDVEEMGFIIAALCHDIAHPGRNNNFMVNAGTPLALTYNDISVLENMHASLTFTIFKNPRFNVLARLDIDTFRALRKNMIEIILSTDMKVHFDCLSRFRLRRETGCFDPQTDGDDRQQTLCMVVKAADVGHGALQWAVHEQWCTRVVTEFYDQGDEEKRRGLPVSFLCDRSQHETEYFKSQVAFLEFVVKPLFVEMEGVESMRAEGDASETSEIAKTCLANLSSNTEAWRSREWQRLQKLGMPNP